MHRVTVDGGPLTPSEVAAVAFREADIVIGDDLGERLEPARALIQQIAESEDVVYGVTTGFGALATSHIGVSQAEDLQYNLIRSHATGVGDPLPAPVVRAMMLLRARTLAQGHSGVRQEIVLKMLELLEKDILPVVPSQGSVGASGDLAPFAHLALPLIGEGRVTVDGKAVPASQVVKDPIRLGVKEGLSLLNGTEGMAAMGAVALRKAKRLAEAADVAAALAVEALLGSERPFRKEIHRLRPHPGQITSAAVIRELIAGSPIVASHHHDFDHAVQDAYSLRCAPQVHGSVRDTLEHMERVLTVEMSSVVDNPLVFPESGEVISGGNFHGQPLAFVLDFAAIALGELGSISERRTDRMLDPVRSNGLPAFLAANPGVESGYMITQYVQAALVAENRVMSHPASVDSIPTSGSIEDHVSMGWGAGKKLFTVIENVEKILAIELLCAAQAIEYRLPMTPAEGTGRVVNKIRELVTPLAADRSPSDDIAKIVTLIADGALLT